MKKLFFPCTVVLLFAVSSCERPSSPDFEVKQGFDIPLVKGVTYRFLGEGSSAIIDTTSENFQDLFLVGGDGLVFLSSEVAFEIGDFDDVIPGIDVDPTSVDAEIGKLEIDDFSSAFASEVGLIESDPEVLDDELAEVGLFSVSFTGDGSADFEQVTGLDPDFFNVGDPITGTVPGDPIVFDIMLDASEFQRAEFESGAMVFEFTNNLGFNIRDLTAELLSGYDDLAEDGQAVGTPLLLGSVDHDGEPATGSIDFDPGDAIEVDLAMRVFIEFDDQPLLSDPSTAQLDVTSADDNLQVRNATANIPDQSLEPDTEDLVMANDNFLYALLASEPEHPGDVFELQITLENQTELTLTNANQSDTPAITIVNSEGEPIGGLTVFENLTNVGAAAIGPGETAEARIDLAGARLTRSLTYELDIGTAAGTAVTVDRNDAFVISSRTTELQFVEAESDIDPQSDIVLEDVRVVEGDFVEAEVEEGELRLNIRNESNIPMVIDNLRFFNDQGFVAKNTGRFFAVGSDIGLLNMVEVPAQQTVQVVVPLDGVGISNRIAYEGMASSPGTAEPVLITSSDVISIDLEGSVQLESASATLKKQDISTTGTVEISKDDFQLTGMDQFVDLASGIMSLDQIRNEIDLDIDTLIISFPNIRIDRDGSGTFGPADSLWFSFIKPQNHIRRGSSDQSFQPSVQQSLENVRIFAPDNELAYNVQAVTEDTRTAEGDDTVRVVRSTDQFLATVRIDDLRIRKAIGDIQRRVESLNDDFNGDGLLDIFDDNEAEVTDFDDLEELSERISGISLINPEFDFFYSTNLGVKGSIVAAIVGINKNGEEVYLRGLPGSDKEVQPGDAYENLIARGAPIDPANMITFGLTPVPPEKMGQVVMDQVISFDSETTNVAEFLSNLPVEIRFVGNVVINPDGGTGFIIDPVEFETNMGVSIPINLAMDQANPASITDTLDADLGDLPDPDDDLRISEMTLYLSYENGLPFRTGVALTFLDENKNEILTATGQALPPLDFDMEAALVDSESRFVNQPFRDVAEIRLTEEQLDDLYRTRYIRLNGELATSESAGSSEVKLRASDFITLSINASFTTSIRVN